MPVTTRQTSKHGNGIGNGHLYFGLIIISKYAQTRNKIVKGPTVGTDRMTVRKANTKLRLRKLQRFEDTPRHSRQKLKNKTIFVVLYGPRLTKSSLESSRAIVGLTPRLSVTPL